MVRSQSHKEEIPILLNPPLVEAIYELRWELQQDPGTTVRVVRQLNQLIRQGRFPMINRGKDRKIANIFGIV